jgi:16S rRNA G1207 methylase RsmC
VAGELRRWVLGAAAAATAEDGVVAFTAQEAAAAHGRAAVVLGFHEVAAKGAPARASQAKVVVPGYRGKTFLPVLSWLVTKYLVASDATVEWHLDKRKGPAAVARQLASLGWDLGPERARGAVVLGGRAPHPVEPPAARALVLKINDTQLSLAADYGVFSPGAVDDGTALLLDIARQSEAVDAVADIGTGYGPLAIGLVAGGVAGRAVATDVDCVALWLAERNAQANGTPLRVECSPEPTVLQNTPLTVCNVPTHIDVERTRELMAGLLSRARHGRLLVVVHASLEARYERYFTAARVRVGRHAGPAHVVLDTAR